MAVARTGRQLTRRRPTATSNTTPPLPAGKPVRFRKKKKKNSVGWVLTNDADPDPWIRIHNIKIGPGSVWRDTNPDPGRTVFGTLLVKVQKHDMAKKVNLILNHVF